MLRPSKCSQERGGLQVGSKRVEQHAPHHQGRNAQSECKTQGLFFGTGPVLPWSGWTFNGERGNRAEFRLSARGFKEHDRPWC